jgi:hypothetical protein
MDTVFSYICTLPFFACVASAFLHMLPRGGHRMKRKHFDDHANDGEIEATQIKPEASSALGTGLLTRWAEGQLSATDVQDLADLAMKSGADHPEVIWLAQIGSAGSSSGGNSSRALYRRYLKDMQLPEVFLVRVPLVNPKDKETLIEAEIPLLLPHDWFAALHKYNDSFEQHMGLEKIEEWWQQHKISNPKMFQHPMLDMRWKQFCVPFSLHGDGAEFHDRDQLMTVSIKPVLFSADIKKDCHFLVASLPKSITVKRTWDIIWSVIGWSFEALLNGQHPRVDPFGATWPNGSCRQGLAGQQLHPHGYFGVCWSITGDLDFFNKDLGTPAMNAESFCWRCRCNRSDRPWNDFRVNAAWRATNLAPANVKQLDLGCPLFRFAGISPLMLQLDVMHCMDLGITEHVVANLLHSIIYFDMPGRGPTIKKKQFNDIWLKIQQAYRDLNLEHRLTSFNLSCIVADIESPFADYPALKKVKAAECKHLLRALGPVLQEHTLDNDQHHHRYGVYRSLIEVYDMIEKSGNYIVDFEQLQKSAQKFQLHYQWLAKHFMTTGHKMWSVVNKFHFFEHLIMQSKYENPALYWAYSGEDFVGRVSRLGHMCSLGKPSIDMPHVLFDRYRIGLHLRLTRFD